MWGRSVPHDPDWSLSNRTRLNAGLVMPPSVDNTHLHPLGMKMSDSARVYMAAVGEYLLAEVLELSGNMAKTTTSTKPAIIEPDHILRACENDTELQLFAHLLRTGGGDFDRSLDVSRFADFC